MRERSVQEIELRLEQMVHALQCRGTAEETLTRALLVLLMLLSTVLLAGCDVIGNIFQAGMWVGMVIVVLILAGVAFLVAKVRH